MTDRLDQLEIKIAYLEQANTELSEELVRQRQEIESLRDRLTAMSGRLDAAQTPPTVYSDAEEKPPHY